MKLLWLTAASTSIPAAARAEFARVFEIKELDTTALALALPEGSWDLICCDFDYPDMADLRLICEIKSHYPSVPIVMLTAQNSTDLALWALRSRVFDVLVKPLVRGEIERMLQRIYGALQARRTQAERKPSSIPAQLPRETRYLQRTPLNTRLNLAVAYVSKNFARAISESAVAALCQSSPSRFCREFRAAYGVTFVEYLSSFRVMEAKRLMANPRMSVADIAAAVGFNDPSYFSRLFRKQEGVSPSEYRLALAGPAATVDSADLPTSSLVAALG